MKCKICGNTCEKIFDAYVLNKYQVSYFQCRECDFIQTESAYWLGEAYSNAITKLDIGLIYRNESFASTISCIINTLISKKGKFIDYGGGYGIFVRMMRDRGFEFWRQDLYCENLFSKYFDISDLDEIPRFDLLTAFEVFEHLDHPMEEVEKMLNYSDNIIFSTELIPKNDFSNWWYFTPETGQHIAFYSRKTLETISQKFHLHLLSKNNLHFISKQKKSKFLFELCFNRKFQWFDSKYSPRKSLLASDFGLIQSKNNESLVL